MIMVELTPLVPLMRAELDSYGGMLAAFDQQQAYLLARDLDEANATAAEIESLAQAAVTCRQARETWVEDFALQHGQSPDTPVQKLLSYFPADHRPLIDALISEINHLIRRVRRRAEQNHNLLARAVEIHRDVLERLHPAARPRTYAPSGHVRAHGLRSISAVG
jgi:hypothetical protein